MFWDFWVEEFDEELLLELGFSGVCTLDKKNGKKIKTLRLGSDFSVLETFDEQAQWVAAKNCKVDAISGFPSERVLSEMASKNICLLVKFSEILNSKNKAKTFYLFSKTVKIARKKKAPIIICSGAKNKWELRSASELIGFGQTIGLSAKEAKDSLFKHQEKIWKRQNLKKTGKYISVGVVKK